MATRHTITTEGKQISFTIDKDYYVIGGNKKNVFDGSFRNMPYCVAYTSVYRDRGHRMENRWGTPAWVEYDNGIFGGQNFNFFKDKNEAIEDFKNRQKLTPKCFKSTFAYADVFFIENDLTN